MPKPYKLWMAELVSNLTGYMNLSGWEIELTFVSKPHPEDGECRPADVNVLSEYQKANICIYPTVEKSFRKKQHLYIVSIMIHELCHTITAPFGDLLEPHTSKTTEPFITKQLESATQKIAVLILKSLPDHVVPSR